MYKTKGYKAVVGSRLSDEQAREYGLAIDAIIEERGGRITPEDVLAVARTADNPLHDFFEWDDSAAAKQYRLQQASYLLRSINVVIKRGEEQEELRAYYNVVVTRDDDTERVYMNAAHVFSDKELHKQVIQEALDELRAWQRKYKQYNEFRPVFKAISKLIK